MRFSILNRFNNGMIFENLDFETHFQQFAFAGP